MAERKSKTPQGYKEDWAFSARGVLFDVQGNTPAFLSAYDRSQEQQTVLRPFGQTEIQTSEPLTPEQILTAEKGFLDELDNFREENGLPTLTRLAVLDKAEEIQTRYLGTLDPLQLTHTTDYQFLQEHYAEALEVTGVLPVVRTRGRMHLASYIETGDKNKNYAAEGGGTELLVAGTHKASVALQALLDSPYHRPALEDESYKDSGLIVSQNEDGVAIWGLALGRGSIDDWAESERGVSEKPYTTYLPGVFN